MASRRIVRVPAGQAALVRIVRVSEDQPVLVRIVPAVAWQIVPALVRTIVPAAAMLGISLASVPVPPAEPWRERPWVTGVAWVTVEVSVTGPASFRQIGRVLAIVRGREIFRVSETSPAWVTVARQSIVVA